MKHCCENMDYYSNNKNSLIEYEPYARSYRFFLHDDLSATRQKFFFCPWCSTKLPKDLGEKWGEVIKKELGYEDPFEDPGYDKLPKEFRSDEWWKKRGL